MIRNLTRCAAAAVLTALVATPVHAQQFVNILTGGTSGVYYPLGVAMSQVYEDHIQGVRTSVQSTRASVENLNLVQAGRGELALTLGDSLSAAWAGDQEAGFRRPLDKLRVVSPLYPNYIQIVASANSGIRSLEDLKGKRVSVGAPRSGTELNARRILAAAGMSYSDFRRTEYLSFGESVEMIQNRQLDATLQSAGLGVASIRDLANSMPITVVAIPEEVVQRIGDPVFISTIVPAGTYDGQDEDVATVAVVNFLVTSSDLDEELGYQLAKQLHDNHPRMVNAHAAARGITLEAAAQPTPVPFHPGAARFYRERGLID